MTIYGWDASHYDGALTAAALAKAKAEGIAFFTHKLGQALGAVDPTQATALAAARDAEIAVIGGYWFLDNGVDPVAEAHKCVATADAQEPWWRQFDGWFWQADAERSTSLPTKAHVKSFCDTLAAETGRVVIVYGSHGQYGNGLAGVGHPLWNANYPSRREAPFKDLYPGDTYAGWSKYSGQVPVIAQYASSATIAGHTTCDANAFRGTLDDLLTLIGADSMQWTDQVVASGDPTNAEWSVNGTLAWQVTQLRTLVATTAADAKTDTASLAAISVLAAAIKAGGGNVDSAPIIAAINSAAATESATVTALLNKIAALQADLAAGASAEAAALAK